MCKQLSNRGTELDQRKAGQLRFAVGLTAVILVGELIGGYWTGSLALLSDAGHVFSDVLSLGLSLFALRLALRPPTGRHSYGLHRAEVFAALVNGVALLGICYVIFREAYERLAAPPEVKSLELLGFALVGLIANWVVLTRLGGHSHDDINLRSAYLHVLGDLLASVGVVIGAVIMALSGWAIVDPIISACIGLLILVGAVRVTGEALHILLEGVPKGIDLEQVAEAMLQLPQVEGVHHLHAWSICSNLQAFSAHVVTCPEGEVQRRATRGQVEQILTQRFGFHHTTLELECDPCDDQSLLRHLEHGMGVEHDHDHECADGHPHHHGHDGEQHRPANSDEEG